MENKEIIAWLDDHEIPAFEQDDLLRLIGKHRELQLNYERQKYRNIIDDIIDAIPDDFEGLTAQGLAKTLHKRIVSILDRAITKYN